MATIAAVELELAVGEPPCVYTTLSLPCFIVARASDSYSRWPLANAYLDGDRTLHHTTLNQLHYRHARGRASPVYL